MIVRFTKTDWQINRLLRIMEHDMMSARGPKCWFERPVIDISPGEYTVAVMVAIAMWVDE